MVRKKPKKKKGVGLGGNTHNFVGIDFGKEAFETLDTILDGMDRDMIHTTKIQMASALVMVVLMVQIRLLREGDSAATVDKSPAYKFYKKRVLFNETGQVYALMFASCFAVNFIPDDPSERESVLHSLLDSFTANSTYIETPTENNFSYFIHGYMSRIMGWLNSCPSSSPQMLGLDKQCVAWTVKDVIKNMPQSLRDVKPEDVINFINKKAGENEACKLNSGPITFLEKPLTGPGTAKGCAALELDIFGDNVPLRSKSLEVSSKVGKSGQMPDSSITQADLDRYLSPLQRKKYVSAAKLGLQEKLNDLNDIVLKAKAKDLAQYNDDDADSGSEAEQLDGSASDGNNNGGQGSSSPDPKEPPGSGGSRRKRSPKK